MRKRRGLLFILVGVALAALAGFIVLGMARRAQETPAQVVTQPAPIKKVYVVVAEKDLTENVAISAEDISTKEFPADFAPPGAVAGPEYAVGRYTTSKIFKGQIIVAPLLADTKQVGQISARVPEGKVAMAVSVNDALNSLGMLRPGDKVDVILTVDLAKGMANEQANANAQPQNEEIPPPEQSLSTQLTMQNVEILAIGAPAGDATTQVATQGRVTTQVPPEVAKTITFLLDHQDAVTLKFIKDSGGIMDLIVRSPDDKRVVRTESVTLDTIYQQFRFRFPEPIK